MKKVFLLSLLLLLSGAAADAGIYKKVLLGGDGTDFRAWPELQPIQGWHQDEYASSTNEINAQVPDGFTFGNAQSVIYAKASYKLSRPRIKTLAQYIEADKESFLSVDPGLVISEAAPAVSADGLKLRSFTFFPKKSGQWERVSYAEEGNYFIAFTLSSLSRQSYEKALNDYLQFIRTYRFGR